MKYDFSGYATKINIKCSDGRTIKKDAFKHNDGQKVPLVWQHVHDNTDNVLGYGILEHRQDGMYVYGSFNDTPAGTNAKKLIAHGDIDSLSIYANKLRQNGGDVIHGDIKEVSLVLSGANPGARIDNLCIEHSDGASDTIDEEAIIYSGESLLHDDLSHEDKKEDKKVADGEKTIQDVYDTLNEEQKNVVNYMIGMALEEDTAEHSDLEGGNMKYNVFDKDGDTGEGNVLSHSDFSAIVKEASESGTTLKKAILAHAAAYGIEDLEVLFPDASSINSEPELFKREDSWVETILSGVHRSPFSRIKSTFVDMTFETARAKGYIKGNEKKEVYLKASKRITTPTTIYVKQKLDRDDIIDVELDTVALIRKQLRTYLNEELALAAVLGDGRSLDEEGKIDETCIRPIWKEDELFSIHEVLATKTDYKAMVKAIALTHKNYKGSGSPVFFTTPDIHTNMLWIEDDNGRRIYESDATLCSALRVSAIVEIPQIEGKSRAIDGGKTRELLAIKVNLKDYNVGADRGGEIASFDDFDIDFNQYKYLMETRCSGALTKAKSAQVFEFETTTP